MTTMTQIQDHSAQEKSPGFNVLLTAATRWEATPIASVLDLKPTGPSLWEGRVKKTRVVLIKTGVGEQKTQEALSTIPKSAAYDLVISAGLCGALQTSLRAGDFVADAREIDADEIPRLRETAQQFGATLHFGKIHHATTVLSSSQKSAAGREHRAVACDMETSAVRTWSAARFPVLGLRVVLDEVSEDLPGHVPSSENPLELARYVTSNILSLPYLLKVGLRTSSSMRRISKFMISYLANR